MTVSNQSIIPDQVAVAPSKRVQRKLDRDEEKARQRAAATPTKTLHEGNPRRRGLLWIVLLVVAALLEPRAKVEIEATAVV